VIAVVYGVYPGLLEAVVLDFELLPGCSMMVGSCGGVAVSPGIDVKYTQWSPLAQTSGSDDIREILLKEFDPFICPADANTQAFSSRFEHLKLMDERQCQWWLDCDDDENKLIQRILTLQASKILHYVGPTLAVLAGSLLVRYLEVQETKPMNMLLCDDADGLGALLAGLGNVYSWTPDAYSQAWMYQEAQKDGVHERLFFIKPDAEIPKLDLAMITLGDPGNTVSTLMRVRPSLNAHGRVLATGFGPFRDWWKRRFTALGFSVCKELRESQYRYVPTGHVCDGAGDLFVLELAKETGVKFNSPREMTGGGIAHQWIAFDELNPEKIERHPMALFRVFLSLLSAVKDVSYHIVRKDDVVEMTWSDSVGHTVTALLHTDERSLSVTLIPFSPRLVTLVQCVVFALWGDDYTRYQPQSSTFHVEDAIDG
jgi:hypothetical protein